MRSMWHSVETFYTIWNPRNQPLRSWRASLRDTFSSSSQMRRNPLMYLFGALVPEERGTLRFTRKFMRRLAQRSGLRLRQLMTHGTILPNKTPAVALPLFKALDLAWPLGFYHVAVLDV